MWQNGYDMRINDRQEVPRITYINQDGNLEVIGQKRVTHYSQYDPFEFTASNQNMRMTKRIYNGTNGNFIFYNEPDLYDAELPVLEYSTFNSSGASFFYSLPNKRTRYSIYKPIAGPKHFIIGFDIDENGKVIGPRDTLRLSLRHEFNNLVPLSGGGYFLPESTRDGSGKINFHFLDSHLKITNTIDADIAEHGIKLELVRKNDERLVLISNRGLFDNFNNFEYLIYNINGKLIKKVRLDPEILYGHVHTLLHWETGDDFYFIASAPEYADSKHYYSFTDILKSNEVDGADIVKRFVPTDSFRL